MYNHHDSMQYSVTKTSPGRQLCNRLRRKILRRRTHCWQHQQRPCHTLQSRPCHKRQLRRTPQCRRRHQSTHQHHTQRPDPVPRHHTVDHSQSSPSLHSPSHHPNPKSNPTDTGQPLQLLHESPSHLTTHTNMHISTLTTTTSQPTPQM